MIALELICSLSITTTMLSDVIPCLNGSGTPSNGRFAWTHKLGLQFA